MKPPRKSPLVGEPVRFASLDELLGSYPDDKELLAQYVSPRSWRNGKFAVVELNPVECFDRIQCGKNLSLRLAFERLATPWQKRLVAQYRKKAARIASHQLLAICNYGEAVQLLDGFHRMVAMALEGVTRAFAVDIASGIHLPRSAVSGP